MQRLKGVVLVAAFCGIASAAPVIVFNSTAAGGHTGSITYGSMGGGAVGQNIDIDSLTGTGTSVNPGVTAACFSCTLNFTTGTNINDRSASGTTWSFNGGGTFTITGGFDLDNNGVLDASDVQTGTVLLSGVFNAPVTVRPLGAGPDLKFTSATLITVLDNRVDGFFGSPGPSTYDGLYTQSFDSLRSRFSNNPANTNYNRWRFSTYNPNGNPSGMLNGTVANTLVVPEPVSVLLSGTAAGILALCLRRQRRRKA